MIEYLRRLLFLSSADFPTASRRARALAIISALLRNSGDRAAN